MSNRFFSFILMTALFAVMFLSCKKDDKEFVVSGTISGEHANWTEVAVSFDEGETWAKTAPISNGKFRMKLPIPAAHYLIPLEIEEYPDKIDVSDKNAKVGSTTFSVRKDDQIEILMLRDPNILPLFGAGVGASYIYADRNVNVSGSVDEKDERSGISFKWEVDQKLKKGWNTVVVTSSGFQSGTWITTSKTDNVPSNLVWVAIGAYEN